MKDSSHQEEAKQSVDKLTQRIDSAEFEVEEVGGYNGLSPTRYGDWQHKGRVSDF